MPPQNPGRVIDAESTIAQRVKLERERRGWSLESTAQRMTAVGCPIHSTAILKIERTGGRRRIQGDEIAAFAQVFDLEVGELFQPLDEVEAEALRARAAEWLRAIAEQQDADTRAQRALAEMLDAARATPRLEDRGELGAWLAGVLARGKSPTGAAAKAVPHEFEVDGYRARVTVEPTS